MELTDVSTEYMLLKVGKQQLKELAALKMLTIDLSYDLAIRFLGIYAK